MEEESYIIRVLNDFTNLSQQNLIKIKECQAKTSRLRVEMCKMMLEASCLVDPNLLSEVTAAEVAGETGDSALIKVYTDLQSSADFNPLEMKTDKYIQQMKAVGLLPSDDEPTENV